MGIERVVEAMGLATRRLDEVVVEIRQGMLEGRELEERIARITAELNKVLDEVEER